MVGTTYSRCTSLKPSSSCLRILNSSKIMDESSSCFPGLCSADHRHVGWRTHHGLSFLTVLGALVAGLWGELLHPSEVWPGLLAFQPISLPFNEANNAKMSILQASVHALTCTNTTSTDKTSMQTFLPNIV
jgi:hypothetical protein